MVFDILYRSKGEATPPNTMSACGRHGLFNDLVTLAPTRLERKDYYTGVRYRMLTTLLVYVLSGFSKAYKLCIRFLFLFFSKARSVTVCSVSLLLYTFLMLKGFLLFCFFKLTMFNRTKTALRAAKALVFPSTHHSDSSNWYGSGPLYKYHSKIMDRPF